MQRLLLVFLAPVALIALRSSAATPQEPASQSATPDGEAAELLREAQGTLRVLNRMSDALPREPLEPEQLVEQVLGRTHTNVEMLTEWIAESVGWLPYRGALRGPRGVLIERRGNSLDQSLLLAEALRSTGLEVRLAHTVLPIDTAAELYALVAPLAVDPSETEAVQAEGAAADVDADGAEEVAQLLGVDAAQLRRSYQKLEISGQELLEHAIPTTIRQFQNLKSLLSENGVQGSADEGKLQALGLEVLRDHWWVQVRGEGEEWKDQDPLVLRSGLELAVMPDKTCAVEELPAEWRHTLALRVVAERLTPEGLESRVALTHVVDSSTLAGGHFLLAFRPLNPEVGGEPQAGEEESGAFLARAAGLETEWLPILLSIEYSGRTSDHHEASIYTDGLLNPDPQLDTKSRKLGDAVSALGGAHTGSNDRASQLTAVWVEYELRTPGQAPEVIRRNIFDLIGEARRQEGTKGPLDLAPAVVAERGLALSGQTQIVPTTCRLSSDFLFRLNLSSRIKNQRLLVGLAGEIAQGRDKTFEDVASSLSRPPLELFSLAQMRLAIGRTAARVYLGGANVLASHHRPVMASPELAAKAATGGVTPVVAYARVIDIVANGVDVLAPEPQAASPASAWDIRLEQGVLDTVLENLALPATNPDGRVQDEQEQRVRANNPSTWMETNPIAEWEMLGPRSSVAPGDSDTHARVAEAMASGQVAIVPRAASGDEGAQGWAPGCWWRVDVATGDTLGIGPSGWGQSMLETAEIEAISAVCRTTGVRKFFATIGCLFFSLSVRVGISVIAGGVGEAIGDATGMNGLAAILTKYGMAFLSDMGASGTLVKLIEYSCQYLVATPL